MALSPSGSFVKAVLPKPCPLLPPHTFLPCTQCVIRLLITSTPDAVLLLNFSPGPEAEELETPRLV